MGHEKLRNTKRIRETSKKSGIQKSQALQLHPTHTTLNEKNDAYRLYHLPIWYPIRTSRLTKYLPKTQHAIQHVGIPNAEKRSMAAWTDIR